MKLQTKMHVLAAIVLPVSVALLTLIVPGYASRAAAYLAPPDEANLRNQFAAPASIGPSERIETLSLQTDDEVLYLPGDFELTARAKSTASAVASSSCVFPLPDGMCVYYGDLHSHTSYSDGQGTPLEAFQTSRANGLHFFAVTDHAFMLDGDEWSDILTQAQSATIDSEFVAFGGFEWSSATEGHISVINTETLAQATDPDYDSLEEFYAWIAEPTELNSLVQFNHPYHPAGAFGDLEYHRQTDKRISLFEIFEGTDLRQFLYRDGLEAGWHVAPTNNSDTHRADWGLRRGRVGVVAPGLTRHHIISALRDRRVFASQDENLVLAMRADGHWMGSVVRSGPVRFEVHAYDPDPADSFPTLELYQDGNLVRSIVANTNPFTWSFALSPPFPSGTWWYIRAVQSDRDKAYTSPIWTHRPDPYDVLIRDNMWDSGDVPSLDSSWQSPDIWIRHENDGEIWHENPVAGETNYVYARIQNIGQKSLPDVDAYFYWASPSLGPKWPNSWKLINFLPVRVTDLAAGAAAVVSAPWNVPASAPDHVSLLVRLVAGYDPIRFEGRPKWENNIARRNVHIVDLVGDPPPATDLAFTVSNPFNEEKTAEIHLSSHEFPAQAALTLQLDPALFDRWMAAESGGRVAGATVNPSAKTIAITNPMQAAVYGIPLEANESRPATLALEAPSNSTLAIQVSEHIDGEEIGGNLYSTPSSRVPQKLELQTAVSSVLVSRTVEITAVIVGDGFVPVPDGTEVRLSTTLGSLDTASSHTENGLATFTFNAETTTGTALVQAAVPGVVTGTAEINIYRTCWARLNDQPADYPTLQAAVNASTHSSDVVKVAGRCFLPNGPNGPTQVAYINKTLTIRGGYATTQWATSDPVSNATILDAEGHGRVLLITGDSKPTIENLHVTGGNANGLGGGPAGTDAGGGVFVNGAQPTIKGTWIYGNSAAVGAGVYLGSSDGTLINDMLTDNDASDEGGALYIEASSPRLAHNTIARNGTGVFVTNTGLNASTVDMANTILVGHDVGLSVAAGNSAVLEATLWGAGEWANGTNWTGAGSIDIGATNIYADPDFTCLGRKPTCTAGPVEGEYHIGADSAALDMGVDAGTGDDIDGDPRFDGRPDIGADELLAALTVSKRADPSPVKAGGQTVYTIQITNTGDTDLHATVIDTLPTHIEPGETPDGQPIAPGGTLTWEPTVPKPGGTWVQTFAVTVETDYVGTLTNKVQVTTEESATGSDTETTNTFIEKLGYLPTMLFNQIVEKCAPKLLREIATGPAPRHVALDAVGRRAFVAHAAGVTVIDVDSFATITTTAVPTSAHGISYEPGRDRIWVTNILADRVVVLDGTTYMPLASLPTGERPHSVAYNPANDRVYVTNYHSWTVSVYNAETLAYVTDLTDFAEPAHIAVNQVTNKIYVANHWVGNHITVIDGANHGTRRITTGLIDAYGVAVDTKRNLIYATAIAHGRISIIDGAAERQLGTFEVRRNGGELAPLRVITVNPDVGPEGHLYVVTSREDGGRDQLLLIPNGWPSLGVPVPLDIASYPLEGIMFDPIVDRVWVTSVQSGLVSVVQDHEQICSFPFLARAQQQTSYYIEMLSSP
jgi:uncharacterized repeat protein (TIGR01451 family)